MCYFPIRCLKFVVFVGSACSIVISLGLLALTIYVNVAKKQVIDAATSGTVNTGLIILYLSAIVFLLLGVAGLSGSMKGMSKKQDSGTCLLAMYSIGVAVFFGLFLGATIFFYVGPEAIFGTDCKQGSKTTLIEQFYKESLRVDSIFCKPAPEGCPCAVKEDSYLYNQLVNVNNMNKDGFDSIKGFSKFTSCPNTTFNDDTTTLGVLEDALNCAGWCPQDFKYRRFTDITACTDQNCVEGLKGKDCFSEMESFMKGAGQNIGLGCLIGTLVCFLNIISICCICFHPSKAGKSTKNFYARMMDTNQNS